MLIINGNYMIRSSVMTIELLKRMMDACYQAKRIRDMLPPLPEGVTSSYIQYLDIIEKMQHQGMRVKISDISDRLSLPRPGVTRTVKDMEQKGYLKKTVSPEDGRVTWLTLTETGQALSQKYNQKCFSILADYTEEISEKDVECMIRTMDQLYHIMCERRIHLDK